MFDFPSYHPQQFPHSQDISHLVPRCTVKSSSVHEHLGWSKVMEEPNCWMVSVSDGKQNTMKWKSYGNNMLMRNGYIYGYIYGYWSYMAMTMVISIPTDPAVPSERKYDWGMMTRGFSRCQPYLRKTVFGSIKYWNLDDLGVPFVDCPWNQPSLERFVWTPNTTEFLALWHPIPHRSKGGDTWYSPTRLWYSPNIPKSPKIPKLSI